MGVMPSLLRSSWALLLLQGSSLLAFGTPLMAQAPVARAARPSGVDGRVVARADGTPILGAQLRRGGSVRGRSDVDGRFRIDAGIGDTLVVRALGFRETMVVVRAPMLEIRLDLLPTVLPGFTTSMGQRLIRASESPRSVTIVDRKEIDAAAAVSANQLLRQLPGLQELPSPPSKTSIAIRGFDDSRVLVLVDGEPVPGALIESRDIGRLSTVGTARIEVTKGPSSVEFGSDALGGVINIVRAAPTQALTMDWLARQGGLGRREATGGVSQTLGRLGYRVNGGWRQSDRVTGYNAAIATFNRIYDLQTDVRYALGRGWTARLDVQGTQERQRFPVDARFNGFIDNRGMQGFTEVQGPLAGGQLRARAFQQRFRYQYRQSRGLLPIRGSADSVEQQERQARYLLAYTKAVGGHAIDLGVQRAHRTLVAPTKVDGDSAMEQVTEAFARDSWSVGPWLLTAGARVTHSTLWGSTLNPSVGAAWQASPSMRLRSNVARGFRAPGFKEIRYTFFNPAGGYTLIGNPTLGPEASWSTSAGGTWAVTPRLSIDAEWYRNAVDGLIDWRYQGDNAAGYQQYANVNVARARMQGIETHARVLLGATELTVGYDHLRTRDLATGLPLSRRASHTARARVSHVWGWREGLAADLSARYTGGAPLIGIPSGAPITGPFSTASGIIGRQGAMFSIDGQFRWTLARNTELSAGVNNLLNQRPALWTPAFDRQWYAGLAVRWHAAP
jgi:outer membrane cobalamin receptor